MRKKTLHYLWHGWHKIHTIVAGYALFEFITGLPEKLHELPFLHELLRML